MATAVASKSVTAEMAFERDTKNTQRFIETPPDDNAESVVLDTIYVPKATLALLGNPTAIRVTIEAA
jgi:hypothetical protein